ncbi:hypothetical protein [Pseudonocardia sp. NPDC049154]|uniref:hypothetical protein n=1 Tax=Pseudonocardia sp. NPDC049154 TaxID=3155501 RepID=UPI0033D4BE41
MPPQPHRSEQRVGRVDGDQLAGGRLRLGVRLELGLGLVEGLDPAGRVVDLGGDQHLVGEILGFVGEAEVQVLRLGVLRAWRRRQLEAYA